MLVFFEICARGQLSLTTLTDKLRRKTEKNEIAAKLDFFIIKMSSNTEQYSEEHRTCVIQFTSLFSVQVFWAFTTVILISMSQNAYHTLKKRLLRLGEVLSHAQWM